MRPLGEPLAHFPSTEAPQLHSTRRQKKEKLAVVLHDWLRGARPPPKGTEPSCSKSFPPACPGQLQGGMEIIQKRDKLSRNQGQLTPEASRLTGFWALISPRGLWGRSSPSWGWGAPAPSLRFAHLLDQESLEAVGGRHWRWGAGLTFRSSGHLRGE